MASKPGIFTDWPWKSLGSFKYVILAPWVTQSLYSYMISEEKERDLINLCIFTFLLVRVLHNQLWISFSRHRTGKGKERIVDKGIEFDQVDRESNWDDQILMQAMIYYIFNTTNPKVSRLPLWRTDGVILTILLHTGPVEFLYYWLHRALHHHYLYSRYHSHHHSSIATEPITSVIHPFAETMVYFMLFAIPQLGIIFTGTASLVALFGYIFYIDFMNNMGHCNFEWIPKWLFSVFPPLKYLMYTPSFHSLHHTQFRTNYSLFMPFYDYIYNTVDKSSGKVQETALRKPNDSPQVVHLTHLTTPESIYHLRLASATMASKPQDYSVFFLSLMRPLTYWFMVATWFCGHTFIVERNVFNNIVLQTWVIPKYKTQYTIKRQREVINNCIEEAIMQAEEGGAKVLSLGLLNQGEELNRYGELYIQNHPKLKIKVVDGSSLATALVLNSIPKGTNQVLLRGKLTKVAHAIALALSHKHIKVAVLHEDEYEKLRFQQENRSNVVLNASYEQKIWLIGDELTEEEQLKAPKGTLFVPFMQFPPKKVRKDCFYCNTPAMLTPKSLENLHSCEDWLPRRVLSSWRVAGIVHALEEWNVHECGDTMFSIDKVWKASLRHGFRPLSVST